MNLRGTHLNHTSIPQVHCHARRSLGNIAPELGIFDGPGTEPTIAGMRPLVDANNAVAPPGR